MKVSSYFIYIIFFFLFSCKQEINQEYKTLNMPLLDEEKAEKLVQLSLDCVDKKYPYKIGYRFIDEEWVKPHHQITPSFFGCWDWHSAVHGHWTMVKILKLFPDISLKEEIRSKLRKNLSKENLDKEYKFFQNEFTKGFERTYGWAWLMKLYSELKNWDDLEAKTWTNNLTPLVNLLSNRTQQFLEVLSSPLRPGTHANSAFSFSLMLDYAKIAGDANLENKIKEFGLKYYFYDTNCPVDYEPSGTDFLSPCLAEAETMSKILSKKDFNKWIKKFFPETNSKEFSNIINIPEVLDLEDPGIGHLIGLMFHRAWSLNQIAFVLEEDEENKAMLQKIARNHAVRGYEIMFDSGYGGAHWLATFAVHSLSYGN